MSSSGKNSPQQTMLKLAQQDPQLAGRLFMTALPVATASISGSLRYRLELADVGIYDVSVQAGRVRVIELDRAPERHAQKAPIGAINFDQPTEEQPAVTDGNTGTDLVHMPDGKIDFVMQTDPVTLMRLASGTSPLRLMFSGALKVRGKRRRALRLRQMPVDLSMRDVARAGINPDPDLLFRALPHLIDPSWARGQRFCVEYVLLADEHGQGGSWYVEVDDGRVEVTSNDRPGSVDSTITLYHETWLNIVSGELKPGDSMRTHLTQVEGKMFPVTLLGRWIERSEGRDERELERERKQRAVQERRAVWGSRPNGARRDAGDPGSDGRPQGTQLLSYEELYALWERQNWKAHELDFTVDKQHWLATPTDGQQDTIWSLSSFYIGEERVAADLAPFVMAAPSGEAEIFLATQLVDEARHAAFFDRFMAEVMALEPESTRARLASLETGMMEPWKRLFDDDLRGIARRIQADPGNLDLFVEGVVTYHMVIEGVLAVTGQHQIIKYLNDHDLYPGFREGFSLVERDEHRHIAFGVKFLKDAVESDPRYRELISKKVAELVPRAAHVFVPPGVSDPTDFVSYDFHSSEVYGFAYRALKRRMSVIGVEVPGPEELMPGPIDEPAAAAA